MSKKLLVKNTCGEDCFYFSFEKCSSPANKLSKELMVKNSISSEAEKTMKQIKSQTVSGIWKTAAD